MSARAVSQPEQQSGVSPRPVVGPFTYSQEPGEQQRFHVVSPSSESSPVRRYTQADHDRFNAVTERSLATLEKYKKLCSISQKPTGRKRAAPVDVDLTDSDSGDEPILTQTKGKVKAKATPAKKAKKAKKAKTAPAEETGVIGIFFILSL